MVALCADLALSGSALLEHEYKRLFKEPKPTVAWLQERRRAIVDIGDNYRQLVESIRDAVYRRWQAAGAPVGKDFVRQLDNALQALTQARQSVLTRWPVGSDDEIATAQASAARGDRLEIDAAFAQIAGVDEETCRRRVEEYRRHGQT